MRIAALLVTQLLVPSLVRAAATGLNVIPTTDLVPYRQLDAQLSNGNTTLDGRHGVFRRPQLSPEFQVGLPWHLEMGLDLTPSEHDRDYRPQMNLKWTPVRESDWVPAVAGGAQALGIGFSPSFYLVASKTLNFSALEYQKFRAHHRNIKLRGIRFHAGILREPNVWRAMVGTDVEVSDHFIFYADWVSGPANAVSLGGVFVIDTDNSITAALLRENDQDRLSGFVLSLTHSFSW